METAELRKESELFLEVEGMIDLLCWKFVNMHRKADFDELKSECMLKFIKVVREEKFDEERGTQFSTFLGTCLGRVIISHLRKGSRMQKSMIRFSELAEDLDEEIAPDYRSEVLHLSKDARSILSIIAKAPKEVVGISKLRNPKSRQSKLRTYLFHKNWSMPRITEAFHELREFLGASFVV